MVDPTEKQKDNFAGIDTTRFYTIVPPIVHPSIFRVVDPRHLAVYNIKDPGSALLELAPYHTGKRGALPAGVLTTGTCFGLAAVMGCDPILFIGSDLSWPRPDEVYARGTDSRKVAFQKSAKFRHNCLLFPDIHGKLVLTHVTFINFWAWMRDNARLVKNRVINCSEAGILRTKHIRVMRFESALRKYCKGELVGLRELLDKAYNYEYGDGLVEKLLLPEFKGKRQPGRKEVIR